MGYIYSGINIYIYIPYANHGAGIFTYEIWVICMANVGKYTAKHLVLPEPVGPPSSYELKTW